MCCNNTTVPPYSMQVFIGKHKGQSEEYGKPLLCILSYKRTVAEGKGRVMSTLNSKYLKKDRINTMFFFREIKLCSL